MGDIQEPNLSSTEQGPPESNPIPSRIGAERWAIAEKETHKIICQFQPTVVSDKRRRDVIDYVRRLIRNCVACEVRILFSLTFLYHLCLKLYVV